MERFRFFSLISVFYLLFSTLCFFSAPAFADLIHLADGQERRGLVVEEHWDRVVLNTEHGEETLLRRNIDEVFYDEPERNFLYLGDQALASGGFSQAKGFFRKTFQINPRFMQAHDAMNRLRDLELKLDSTVDFSDPVRVLKRQLGLTLQTILPDTTVLEVRKGSLAERVGILRGDGIIAAWGYSLKFLPVEKVADPLIGLPDSSLKLTLERELALPPTSADPDWLGLTLGMERLGLTVLYVKPAKAAALIGLKPRDRIVVLNGKSTRYLPLRDARQIFEAAKEKGMTFFIHRDLMITRK